GIGMRGAVGGGRAGELVGTSNDSYVRPLDASAQTAAAPGPRLLAAAVQGTWPSPGGIPFRLVLVGNSSFAANAFFSYASNMHPSLMHRICIERRSGGIDDSLARRRYHHPTAQT